jgi:hypothetical protein
VRRRSAARRTVASADQFSRSGTPTHAHHIAFRSQGGGDEPENQVGLCPFHHLRCVHGGYLRVFGRAPDALVWFRGGKVWRGPGAEVRGDASHAAFAS